VLVGDEAVRGLAPRVTELEDAGVRAPQGYAVIRVEDEQRAELDWTDDPNDPDRLLFTTSRGYPVRHNQFYKRVFKPTIIGDPDNEDPELRRAPALPQRLHAFRFDDLRHTCAALSLAAPGGNLAMVKERLGHEQIGTTADLYGKRVPSVDASIADAVGASIFAAEPGPTNVTPLALRQ
jgi:integrase